MTITNYTTLQSTVADYLNRTDLTSIIPTFIQLAESQINRDVRHYEMETRSTATIDAGDQYIAGSVHLDGDDQGLSKEPAQPLLT
jgi:hypothetical protein